MVCWLGLRALKTLYFCIVIKKELKKILQRILQENEKKILGTSDPRSIRRSSHQPSDPVYYIEDCQIYHELRSLGFEA